MEKLILRNFIAKAFFIVGFILVAGCGGEVIDGTTGLDGYTVTSDTFSEKTSSSLVGTGTVRFDNPLTLNEPTLWLKGSLDLVSNSSITAKFFSSSLTLSDSSGIEVQFSRSGASVLGQIVVRGSTSTITSSRLSFYVPANLELLIQVLSTTNGSRVVVWRKDSVTYSLANADINTQTSGNVSPNLPAQGGLGTYAGLTLVNSTVTKATVIGTTAY